MIFELYKSFVLLPETYIAHGLAMSMSDSRTNSEVGTPQMWDVPPAS